MEPIKIIDKEAELNFIKKLPHIPDNCKKQLIDCLEKIPDLYSGAEFRTKTFPPELFQHDIEFINEEVSELSLKPYPASGIRLAQLKEQINDLVKSGVLKEGDSPYVSPVFFVLKKQNEGASASCGRLVYDYRKLNEIVKPMHYPLTKIDNLFEKFSKYKLFSLIEIKNAFLSVALTERAKQRSAIVTPFGVFLPQRTPFGLKTSPAAFCYVMRIVLKELDFLKKKFKKLFYCNVIV
jgi:hypothetical protein